MGIEQAPWRRKAHHHREDCPAGPSNEWSLSQSYGYRSTGVSISDSYYQLPNLSIPLTISVCYQQDRRTQATLLGRSMFIP